MSETKPVSGMSYWERSGQASPASPKGRPAPSGVGLSSRVWDYLENPVMGREFRARMRGTRSYVITGSYTLVVAVFVMAAYWTLSASLEGSGSPVSAAASISRLNRHAAEVGRGIWMWGC